MDTDFPPEKQLAVWKKLIITQTGEDPHLFADLARWVFPRVGAVADNRDI